MIGKIMNWLEGFSLDALGPKEGWAVFPQGVRQLSRKADILGAERCRQRLTLKLCRHGHDGHAALEALSLENAPRLGTEQTVRMEDIRLAARGKDGLPRYEAKLIFEFTV